MKLVSVVVPCYNAFMYLEKCIEHLLIQTIGLENIEIILVDDASTDGGATLGIIMQYEQKYPENIIAVSLEENVRQGGARNVGVSYANGQYLIFCDADDWRWSICTGRQWSMMLTWWNFGLEISRITEWRLIR